MVIRPVAYKCNICNSVAWCIISDMATLYAQYMLNFVRKLLSQQFGQPQPSIQSTTLNLQPDDTYRLVQMVIDGDFIVMHLILDI